ncbi:MAG: DUF1353 domain-containing protein [Rhizobiaceae bacterium]|nr:DUF1353 domain-containing protein [Rhizobiaceae bacterium]
MQLLRPFAFVDDGGFTWEVPAGTVVNGASIPQVFWSFGPPFVGDYRRASVVHDHFCVVRTRPSQDVHRMFHEGCLLGGVSSVRAGTMYLAVRTFGPNWTVLASALSVPGAESLTAGETIGLSTSMDSCDYAEMLRWIEETDPDVAEIDARANAMTRTFPAVSMSTPDFGPATQ